ncbi:hypothetical protein I317_00992 [Kwoniella heveanensis CBS 569]|nr:hypothetical protein I317_00992 [Kwoniella heveanensis CBS 569]
MSAILSSGGTPKGAHYNASLTAALLRGAWAESNPGQAPNKTELSWGELVRKWGKHTGGNTVLIHHLRDISLLYLSSTAHPATSSSGFINVSTPTSPPPSGTTTGETGGAVGVGSSNSSNESGSGSHSSFVHVPHPHIRHRHKPSIEGPTASASGSGSTTRAAEGSNVGTGSKASYLSSGDLDGDDSDDPRYWGEGSGWWNGVGSEAVDEVKEGIKAIEGLIVGGKLGAPELMSARLILAYHLHALGSHEDAIRTYEGIDWNAEGRFGVVQGDAAVLERVRGRCLQGLSYELSQTPDYEQAIQTYLSTIPLLTSLSAFALPLPSYLSAQTSETARIPFDPYREVFRHLSTALSRAAALSARTCLSNTQQTLRILRTYHALSASWPSTFRPVQRQKMLNLYLRALNASYPSARQPVPEQPLLYGESSPLTVKAFWHKEVIDAIRQGRMLLSSTTTFPRAGSVNRAVIGFSELTVALYSRSASLGREVIAVLWWAMTLTFQSQAILRHLTHLLSDVGDSIDARRVFELYVQLVLKARQTQQPEISLQLKRRPTDEDTAHPGETKQQVQSIDAGDPERKEEEMTDSEIDGDEQFLETLLAGTRLFSRDLGEAEEAWKYACLAGDVIDQKPVKPELRARVEESKGIVRMTTAAHNVDSIDRPTFQAQAINHLVASTDLLPTASSYYHLAHCQSEARSVDSAIESIRSSLELDSQNIQAWHLLALLLSAQRDWEGAMKACEAGVSVWEQDEELAAEEEEQAPSASDTNIDTKDFAVIPPSSSTQTGQLASTSTSKILLRDGTFPHLSISPPRTTPLSRSAKLEHVIRLRMTLNVVVEKTQGPEMAMLKQQELFAFFSARSGKNRGRLGYGAGFGKGGGMKSVASSSSMAALAGGAGTGTATGSGTTRGSLDGKDGLGGSFISVGLNEGNISVQPPTPGPEREGQGRAPFELAEPIGEKSPIQIQTSSPSNPATGHVTPEMASDDDTEKPRRSLSIRSKMTTKHLHVPASGAGVSGAGVGLGNAPASRTGSVRRLTVGSTQNNNIGPRERTISAAHSIAPTAIHSHFRNAPSSRTVLPPPPPLRPTEDHGRTPAESRILSNLWLMSAATFRRWGKLEQSLVAIEEAEVLDPENADVWVQLGMYHATTTAAAQGSQSADGETSSSGVNGSGGIGVGPNGNSGGGEANAALSQAEAAFVKSLLLRPDHPPAIVGLSKLYLQTNQVDLAESLLNQLTQETGWDVAEGWFWLGKVCERQGRADRARECWTFALGLERGRPVRSWHEVSRWL